MAPAGFGVIILLRLLPVYCTKALTPSHFWLRIDSARIFFILSTSKVALAMSRREYPAPSKLCPKSMNELYIVCEYTYSDWCADWCDWCDWSTLVLESKFKATLTFVPDLSHPVGACFEIYAFLFCDSHKSSSPGILWFCLSGEWILGSHPIHQGYHPRWLGIQLLWHARKSILWLLRGHS